jgi:DNA-binding transcriptional ArsR family regulator
MRLRPLSLIACHPGGESCVCDLLDAFDVTAPSISYHLKILREAGLISSQRRGTWVYYRVNPGVMERMSAVLAPASARLAGLFVHVRGDRVRDVRDLGGVGDPQLAPGALVERGAPEAYHPGAAWP